MHHFTISTCEIVPQFNDSLRARYTERRGSKELQQLKHLSLKIQEATSKIVVITEKKENQYARQIIYIN